MRRITSYLLLALTFAAAPLLRAATPEARVTQIVREVKLLPEKAKPEPAELNATVDAETGVRTGDRSKSELTFGDQTITRLGANSVYHYNNGGRSVDLEDGGSLLLCVPKSSGGAAIRARAVSVAVTGTTLILETTRAGRSKLIVLEGRARLSLRNVSGQSRDVRGGQMLDVPAGARTLPLPVDIDVNDVMKQHPLIVGFRPLPSQNLIAETARNGAAGEPVYQGQQVSGGVPILTGLGGFVPPVPVGGGNSGGSRVRNPAPGAPNQPRPAFTGAGRRPASPVRKQQKPPPIR